MPSSPENDIAQWQKEESEQRYKEYLQNPEIALHFDEEMDEIEKGL